MMGRWAVWLGLLWAGAAAAQTPELPPRVVIVFDTSGSMGVDVETGEPTGGDNSREYPGDGRTSRLFVAKDAVSGLVATTSEVDFALLRYPQREGAGINRGVVDGFQNNTYQDLLERPLNYGGTCDGRLRPAPDAAHSLLVPFGNDNEPEILAWMDHQEDWPGDRELRADGPTPIVESLRLARQYLAEVAAQDPDVACRRYSVVVLTDGGESCLADAERGPALRGAADALRQLELPDGAAVDVSTYVVAFGVSQRSLGLLSQLAQAGGTALDGNGNLDLRNGGPYTADDLEGLRLAFARVLADAVPVERCDGEDNDCDGVVDEGVLNACGQCGPAPAEICDGLDDDCDGRIDEGALNACGRCGPVPAEICNGVDDDCDGSADEGLPPDCERCAPGAVEVCNGLDDDCDGAVDNLPGGADPLERPCGNAVGICTAGVERCFRGRWAGCTGVQPADEACDGLDNDCDGAVDEATRPCGAAAEIGDVGECRVGRRLCDAAACADDPAACGADGWLLACEGAIDPVDEFCDGRDNDCDGEADEGLFNACGQCGPPPAEACNGADDNCDGRVDEDAVCPPRHICLGGACVQRCDASGECAAGQACLPVYPPDGRFCHPDACDALTCAPGLACDPELGGCGDPCRGVDCAPDEGCDLGACVPVTCRHLGCPAGQRCFDDRCEPDPCADLECEAGRFCRDGACVAACVEQACGEGLRCVDGACVEDPCGGRCLRGQVCDQGQCVADACLGVACPVGTRCLGGECRADAPCVAVICPAGTTCVGAGECTDHTPSVPPVPVSRPRPDAGAPPPDAGQAEPDLGPPTPDQGARDAAVLPPAQPGGGDGGGCAASGAPGAAWTVVLLALFGFRRRRWALLALLGLAGCDDGEAAQPPEPDAAPVDMGRLFEMGRADQGTGCVPSPEICNGVDDDCDGLVDDADDEVQLAVLDDPENCGACGTVCQAPNADLTCQAGVCIIVGCRAGYGDFNGLAEDGCETDCVVTNGGIEQCDGADNDCDGATDEDFDFQADPANCGGCGRACAPVANADVTCVEARCESACRRNFHDLDGEPGCEYACEPRSTADIGEYCNGQDDDCDGQVDEAADRVDPQDGCGEDGVCAPECDAERPCPAPGDTCAEGVCVAEDGGPAGRVCETDADCRARHPGYACIVQVRRQAGGFEPQRTCVPRLRRPMCDGEAGYRCVRSPHWQFGNERDRCDALDNDCDGRTDEDFAAQLLTDDREAPRPCAVGQGVCQRQGVTACAEDGRGTVCAAAPGQPGGPDDQCDGVDDDCDGALDEAFEDQLVPLPGGGSIFAYEASRPGATAQAAGVDPNPDDAIPALVEGRACSKPGVLPWADVPFEAAAQACEAAGYRLCTAAEWGLACGGAQREAFPYGGVYDALVCNGGAYDIDPATRGVQDGVLPTGAAPACERAGAFDLSGNLKEWVDTHDGALVQVRGGGYRSNIPSALACGLDDDLKVPEFRHPSLGFRCCAD